MSDAPQYGWEAPRNVLWLGLFASGASVSPLARRREEERIRELVKRGTPFCTGGNRVTQPPETRACSELARATDTGDVSTVRTGLLSYVSRKDGVCGIDSWGYSTVLRVRVSCPTCLGTKAG
jgi:hypothetical protein